MARKIKEDPRSRFVTVKYCVTKVTYLKAAEEPIRVVTKVTHLPKPEEPIRVVTKVTYVSADNTADAEKYRLLQAQRLLDDFERDQGGPPRTSRNSTPGCAPKIN